MQLIQATQCTSIMFAGEIIYNASCKFNTSGNEANERYNVNILFK